MKQKQEKKKIDYQNLLEGLIAFIIIFGVLGILLSDFVIYPLIKPDSTKVVEYTTEHNMGYNVTYENEVTTEYFNSIEDAVLAKKAKQLSNYIGFSISFVFTIVGHLIHKHRQKKYKRTS